MAPSGEEKPSVSQIASELGVDCLLEGAVRERGGRMRITVQLIDARGESHLWAESFDRELQAEALVELQTEIAGRVAETVGALLVPEGG